MTDTLTTEEIEQFRREQAEHGIICNVDLDAVCNAALKGVEPTTQERVVKSGGDYTFEGVVVARFNKLSGVERVVVENDDGILHIFNPSQLTPKHKQRESSY